MAVRLQKLKGPVLVTGAAGFIGRRLVMRLLDDGQEVIAFDLMPCPEALSGNDHLTWVSGDIRSAEQVGQVVAKCKTIFHLAAVVGDWGQAELHESVTVTGTRNVFQAVRENNAGQRIVLASSIVVYGDQIHGNECHESMMHGETFGPYSESKQAQERLAQQFVQCGLDIRVVRPANVYGAGSKPWVEDLCKELKRGVPALVGGGDFNAGLVHVENVVEILLRVARHPSASGQIFNAADEEGVTWLKYFNDLAHICGAPKPRSIPRTLARYFAIAGERAYSTLKLSQRPPLTREALNLVGSAHDIDMAKAKAELSYKPKITYEDGIAEIRDYLSA